MKTVMKKMFSLLLVAVMLVSAVPTAFADEYTATISVTLDGASVGSFTATGSTLNPGSLESVAASKLTITEVKCLGVYGSSGTKYTDTITLTGNWTLEVRYETSCANCGGKHVRNDCLTYCNRCGGPGHDESAEHCATCGWAEGHNTTCTAGCKNTYNCDWTFEHLGTCTHNMCAVCKQAKHEGSCCSECKSLNGTHTATCTFGCTKAGDCTWAYTHNTSCLSQHKCTVCEQFGHLEANCPTTPCDECDGTVSNHARNCPTLLNNTGKVKVYLNLNYGNAYAYGEEMEYVWADKNELLKDVVADLVEPRRDGHYFQHWTTRDGTVIDRYNKEDRATADGVMIYAQWVDIIQSDSGTVDVTVNLMYSGLKEYINNIKSGVEMGNVLEYAGTPVRLNYKFLGWYWDENCTNKVDVEEKIYNDRTIYAKWEYRDTNNDILLKVYLNGNTHTPVRTIDMYKYTRDDGYISLPEVKEAVKLYYTGKNTDGMYFDGLYDSTEWLKYVDNKKTADAEGSIEMEYEPGVDTIVYVMVQNAKARSYTASTSSSTTAKADSSNPKTGDAIYAPIMIMGASVSALAVLYYLNKKRAY